MTKFSSFIPSTEEESQAIAPELRGLYSAVHAGLAYLPLTAAFNFAGFIIIFFLSIIGLLDPISPLVLLYPATLLLIALAQAPLRNQLNQRIHQIAWAFFAIYVLSTAAQIFIWQGIAAVIFIFMLLPLGAFIALRGATRIEKVTLAIYTAIIGLLIFWLDQILPYPRIGLNTLSAMASLTIYIALTLALAILIISSSGAAFKTITARIVTTFAFITTLSAITTLLIGSLTSFFYDQEQTFEKILAITSLKQERVESALANLETNASTALTDPVVAQRIEYILRGQRNTLLYKFNYDLIKTYLGKIQTQTDLYEELLLLDSNGVVLLSTIRDNETKNFADQPFFQQALLNQPYAIQATYPGASQSSIIFVRPIVSSGALQGVLAARGNFDIIAQIVEARTGQDETLETYLVDTELRPLTKTLAPVIEIRTQATQRTIEQRYNEGRGIYPNYNNQTVIGYYVWIPRLQAALVAEIERAEVFSGVLTLLGTNLSIGLFTTIMAFAVVFITARSISAPITDLAGQAVALAAGDLHTRIPVNREDEIGTLATSFNSMAQELQGLVRNLESKVDERTQDLQAQANRLRLAAEIARDATTSTNLDSLLQRSSKLLHERFGFYHTGIYLMDSAGEYAVLRAAPTEAGQMLIERNYRIAVGQTGIISAVASTGEARIALDADRDIQFNKNPLLPDTRSEVALPLKVNEKMIGVLDVQSAQPEAFAQEDIAALQIVADQLALAIQRTQVVDQLQSTLHEIEQTYREVTLNSWREFAQTNLTSGYSFDGVTLTPIQDLPDELRVPLQRGEIAQIPQGKDSTLLAAPLKLRGRAIGALTIRFAAEKVGADTLSLVEETANRLALALENARLYAETQKRAQRDRLLSEISTRISSSFNVENIIRSTAEEFGKILPEAEIVVEIEKNEE